MKKPRALSLAVPLALFFLVGPGSLQGVLLLAHGGFHAGVGAIPSSHALMQLAGFFMTVIWAFLAVSLPAMLLAPARHEGAMVAPLVVNSIVLCVLFAAPSPWWWALGAVNALAANVLLMLSIRDAKRSLRVAPFPTLLMALFAYPCAWLLGALDRADLAVNAMLWCVVLPIILSMAFRMLSSLAGLALPSATLFNVASLAWCVGCGARLVGMRSFSSVAFLVGAVVFAISMRVWSSPRVVMLERQARGLRSVTLAHVRMSFALLALGPLAMLMGSFSWYADDLGRHLWAIGFALLLASGIIQRAIPNMLAARAPNVTWMWINFGLLTSGTLLRAMEMRLPEGALAVRAAAVLTYVGVFSFVAHLMSRILLGRPAVHPVLVGIRSPSA